MKRFRFSTVNPYYIKFDPRFWGLFADDGEGGDTGAGGGDAGAGEGAGEGDGADAGAGTGEGDQGSQAPASGDGAGAEGAETTWRDTLKSDDAKKFAESSPDVDHLVGRALEMRQKLSNAITPPGKDATDEEVASYRKQIGVPDTADAYEFAMPEGVEPTEVDTAFQAAMGEVMHANNVPAGAAKAMAAAYNDFVAKTAEAQVEADKQFAEQSETDLRKAWPGEEFDRNKTFANRAVAQVFGEDLEEARHMETKDGRFFLDHPIVLKAFAAVGREMAEGGLVPPLSEGERDAAQDQITAIRAKAADAQARGDSKEANRLFKQEQELIARTQGNQNIVGAGRAA
jgi:hypothetical protein